MNSTTLTTSTTSTTDLGWGIHLVDTGYQRGNMAACYVMEDAGELAVIETGTKDTVPRIMAFLDEQGLDLNHVKYVIVTHVHLDHAGGAGLLMQQLPNATLVVHEKGVRHMIDPAKLQAGATAVYGEEEFNKTYGDLVPVDSDKTWVPVDEDSITLGTRTLTFVDTPGHARHHFCVYDSKSQGFFTGDTFGLAYQQLTNAKGPFIIPTTTPVQFDPEAMKQSIDRLLTFSPKHLFLTHYGMVDQPEALAIVLQSRIETLVAIAKQHRDHADRTLAIKNDIMAFFLDELVKHECELSKHDQVALLETDAMLNAQGLDVWLGSE